MSNIDLLKNSDIGKIADEGTKIYLEIKDKYDPEFKGKFLAIEVESKEVFMGETSVEAMKKAKEAHPEKIFYIAKIGYDTIETIAKHLLNKHMG